MSDINQAHFQDADAARVLLESMRWPDGIVCPHCDSKNAYKLTPKAGSKSPVRKGVYKCAECREQFTATVGTIFEDSKIPLHKWLLAIHLLCASKKGMSAHQLHRMLGVAYKTAWFMAHRTRYGMSQPSFKAKLKGVIEADETYVGGVQKFGHGRKVNENKRPVFAMVKRGGEVRSFHIANVTGETLGGIIKQHVDRCAHLCTDEFPSYRSIGDIFAAHGTVVHSKGEYVKGYVHVNSAEGFFSLLKRGINGTYHKVSQAHLHRYLSEFDFRYNNRKVKDVERTQKALVGMFGKRLQLRDSKSASGLSEPAHN
jgi:transposase-like protein